MDFSMNFNGTFNKAFKEFYISFMEFPLAMTGFIFSEALEAFPYAEKLFEMNTPGFSRKDGVGNNVLLLDKCIIGEAF